MCPSDADTHRRLVASQKEAFDNESWGVGGVQPYALRRDNTLGQFVANLPLIRLEPFVRLLKGKTAVTICDGRGVEASYFKILGLNATATDLSAVELPRLRQQGFLDNWAEENAESLSFPDAQFDWGMVKSGLHHLPRPLLGLYELLRVSREGVIVLEGHDSFLLRFFRANLFQGRDWEPSGNYVYRFTRREIEKVCLALDLPGFAIHTWYYKWNRRYEPVRKGTLGYRCRLAWNALLNLFLRSQGNLFNVVIFKTEPSTEQVSVLRKGGFRFVRLQRNPYLRRDDGLSPSEP